KAPPIRITYRRWRGTGPRPPNFVTRTTRSEAKTRLALTASHLESHPPFPLSLEQRRPLPSLLRDKEGIIKSLAPHPLCTILDNHAAAQRLAAKTPGPMDHALMDQAIALKKGFTAPVIIR